MTASGIVIPRIRAKLTEDGYYGGSPPFTLIVDERTGNPPRACPVARLLFISVQIAFALLLSAASTDTEPWTLVEPEVISVKVIFYVETTPHAVFMDQRN